MKFGITVVSNTPLTPVKDIDEVAITFLEQIGYLPKGYGPRTSASNIKESVPYRLFVEFFLKRREKPWLIEDLATALKTSKPTIYRHINKLKSMDLLEDMAVEDNYGQKKKAYRIKYGDLSKAWNFVEAHVAVAIENYRKTVNHLQYLSEKERR